MLQQSGLCRSRVIARRQNRARRVQLVARVVQSDRIHQGTHSPDRDIEGWGFDSFQRRNCAAGLRLTEQGARFQQLRRGEARCPSRQYPGGQRRSRQGLSALRQVQRRVGVGARESQFAARQQQIERDRAQGSIRRADHGEGGFYRWAHRFGSAERGSGARRFRRQTQPLRQGKRLGLQSGE